MQHEQKWTSIRRTGKRSPSSTSGLRLLEHSGLEAMALQEFVELRPVSLGQRCSLGHIAAGDLQQPDKIVPLELLAGLLKRGEHPGVLAQRPLHQGRRNHARGRERDRLLEEIEQLPYVA